MKNGKFPCDKHVPKDKLIETIHECEDCDEFCIMHGCKIGRKARFVFRSILPDLDKAPKNITRQTLLDYDPKKDSDKVLLESQIPQGKYLDFIAGKFDLGGCVTLERFMEKINPLKNPPEDPRKKD